jgi:uncharacterized protein involved in type VI secretion and phage assembly
VVTTPTLAFKEMHYSHLSFVICHLSFVQDKGPLTNDSLNGLLSCSNENLTIYKYLFPKFFMGFSNMSFFDLLIDTQTQETMSQKIFGVVIGIVTNNYDKTKPGQVKVEFPWLRRSKKNKIESYWARIATPMAGKNRGIYFLPEVEDEVLVVFEHGDVRFPYIIGTLWNGVDTLPIEAKPNNQNNIRLIKSRSGHTITLDDTAGQEIIEIRDKSKKNSIKFDTKNNSITIEAGKDIKISAPNGTMTLDAKEISIQSTGKTNIQSQAGMNIKATANMNVQGKIINLN